jgi:hypothetical protein
MADPQSNAELRDVFNKQLEALKTYCQRQEESVKNEEPSLFFAPELLGWSGDLADIEGMSKAFDREEIYQDFRDTIQEDDKGVTADLEVEVTQGDFIARMERAYRQRHHSSLRDRMHAAARFRGHRHDNGVLTVGVLGYLEHLKNMASS